MIFWQYFWAAVIGAFGEAIPMKPYKELQGMGRYMALGVEMVIVTAVGALVGWWLDKRTGKEPLFLIVFFLLGALGGIAAVWRVVYENGGTQKRQ